MQINEWALEALKERGIEVTKSGKIRVEFFKGKVQEVKDLPTALRQQQHIIDQQKEEQKDNEAIGILMRNFNDIVTGLKSMTAKDFTSRRKENTLLKLRIILEDMSKKTEKLRKEGYNHLMKVFNMLEKDNIPAATWASQAALEKMRKRWLTNEKVIDRSTARLEALKSLSC
jgi:hypothetical protein